MDVLVAIVNETRVWEHADEEFLRRAKTSTKKEHGK